MTLFRVTAGDPWPESMRLYKVLSTAHVPSRYLDTGIMHRDIRIDEIRRGVHGHLTNLKLQRVVGIY